MTATTEVEDNRVALTATEEEPPRLSLVVPAYNEAARLAQGIPKLLEVIARDETEVIVVDDGSTDGTAEVARRHLADVPRHVVMRLPTNSGKGAAVRAGVVKARGEIIAYMDADMATDPADLIHLIEALHGSPVAVGSRTLEASVIQEKSHLRTLMSRAFGMVVSSAVDLPMKDTQCGFKAFHGSVAKLLFHGAQVDSFAFDIEVLTRAARLGLCMDEVPVRWTEVSGSKVHVVKDTFEMLVDVGRTRLRRTPETPIHGVAITDIGAQEGARLLRAWVRPTDTVLSSDSGAVALFPCVPPTVAALRVQKIQAEMPMHRFERVELTLDTLQHLDFRSFRAAA
jgi:glycosyltransferase involved in cell wall biosynthesis